MVVNLRFETADSPRECNASLFLQDCLDDVASDLTFSEKRAVVLARKNGWLINKGERMRVYEWTEDDCYFENGEYTSEPLSTMYEIPEISDICSRLDLYP